MAGVTMTLSTRCPSISITSTCRPAHSKFLPTLQTLITHGTWRWLGTTAEVLHVSAWPSLYTGVLPGEHGVYYTFQPAPGHQSVRRFGSGQYGQPPFWQMLGRAGTRCTVLDAPYTHPCPEFDGIQVFEWGTWAHYWHPMSTPPRLLRQLRHACGPYPVEFEANQVGLGPLDLADLHQRLLRAIVLKTDAVGWLMARAPWDLFFLVFAETHPAAHYFWHPAEATTRKGGPAAAHFLRDIYSAIDRAIGEILRHIPDDVTVVVTSGDGVGPNYTGWHLLPEVLQRLHATATPSRGDAREGAEAASRPPRASPLKALRDLVPSDLRRALSRQLPTRWRDALMARWATAHIDWSRTRAYCLPTDLEGCIRINLRGREPAGIVAPGSDYEGVCKELTTAIQQLVNPATGHPAVRRVIRADEIFPGERRHSLPDLIVLWSDDAPIQALQIPSVGLVQGPSPDARRGTHRPQGFALTRGHAASAGHVVESGHIVDVAPTLFAHFGLTAPQHLRGGVWSELASG